MKVILNQDVHNLGEEGDIKDVAPGYARNYLIPQDLAVLHNKANVALFEHRRAAIEKRKEEKRLAALSLKEQLNGIELTIEMTSGETGKLFGSVTSANVAEELQKQGHQIERKRIELPEHALKNVGTYEFKIKLYDSHVAELTLIITSPESRKRAAEMAAAKEAPAVSQAHDEYDDDDEAPDSENADLEAAAAELEAEEAAAAVNVNDDAEAEDSPAEDL
ncbi:MAG: 50S ribosomal protein L9 [Spirochaetales bacterium]|nr:50S ribosomal protein L9 [Spirochaetales bacterium]